VRQVEAYMVAVRMRAGNSSCYTWGDFFAGESTDHLTPYNADGEGGRIWQESFNGAAFTDNPRLTVECYRFDAQSIIIPRVYFLEHGV